jgi:SCY1-like protein 1
MKDPFPPARAAAVLALSATQQFYSLIEVATRLIPALAPLTCDPEKQVLYNVKLLEIGKKNIWKIIIS